MEINKKNIVFGIILIIALWLLSGVIIHFIDSENRGTFGDMFGSINALFSGLALFGIILSILIQQNELNLQRTELSDTRKEHKINRLTTMLFKQLEYLNSFIDSLNYSIPKGIGIENDTMILSKFVYTLDELEKSEKDDIVKTLIELNSNVIANTVSRINMALDNLDETFLDAGIDEREVIKLKRMFINNLNLFFTPLLGHKIRTLEGPSSQDKELFEIEKSILAIELSQIMRVLKYGKKDE
jgi:hypothetical protein